MSKSNKMDRTDKRISRSLSLQIYYAWIISETHPKEILDYVRNLLKDKEINDTFYINGEPIENNKLESEIEKIRKKIEIEGFEKVAMNLSISETAIKGGNLGWISENIISEKFRSKIINTPIGNISEPIILPQGILFFKLRDKRKSKKFTNLEDAKNQLVNAEKTKILKMYSLSHFENLRRVIPIYYY